MRMTQGLSMITSSLAPPPTEACTPWAVLALQRKEKRIVANSTIAIYMIDYCFFTYAPCTKAKGRM
jgi:hypothetical protein